MGWKEEGAPRYSDSVSRRLLSVEILFLRHWPIGSATCRLSADLRSSAQLAAAGGCILSRDQICASHSRRITSLHHR